MTETSYNGWPASPDPHVIGVNPSFAPAGVPFPGGVKAGDVSTVLGYVAVQIHTTVEPLVPGWCWGYEWRKNVNDPSTLSTHASATSVDVNAPRHANGARDTFSTKQIARIREILREVQGVVWWGRDWEGTVDEMHFEIHGTATSVRNAAAHLNLPDAPVTVRHRFPLPRGYYFGPLSGPKESISGMAGDGSDEQWRPSLARIQTVVHVRADGLYGPVTINSVKGWQAAHRLSSDGLTGPITWTAMRL
jgi:peptidoglycan hydrolase-like protein with peptidoglycan-binding domain